jgi:hypothetical protein
MREYYRVYRNMKRHEQGTKADAPQRPFLGTVPPDEQMDPRPFKRWIEEKLKIYETLDDLATACGTTTRLIYRYRTTTLDYVPLATVDLCLTNEGSTGVWELYPEAYEVLEDAA